MFPLAIVLRLKVIETLFEPFNAHLRLRLIRVGRIVEQFAQVEANVLVVVHTQGQATDGQTEQSNQTQRNFHRLENSEKRKSI